MFIITYPFFFLNRNVPGVALYMTSLTQMRTFLAQSPYFVHVRRQSNTGGSGENVSVLPSLTSQGNLLAGATTRVAVGFLLNPFSVLKARFEVPMNPSLSMISSKCLLTPFPRAIYTHTRLSRVLLVLSFARVHLSSSEDS